MTSKYFYLLLDVDKLDTSELAPLSAQTLFQQVGRDLFGEVGCPHVDVLKTEGSSVLVRVQPRFLRKFRAAIALSSRRIHVCREAPSLQALI